MTELCTLGSYRLIAELGHGGMADVFLAAVEGPVGWGFTKLAVVKMLRSHLAEDPEFVSMLLDEARITARLAHRNVVQLFEVGHIEDRYFLAIEHLEGQPLHRIERRAARNKVDVRPELYYAVVSDVLAGLQHAHELADYDGTPLEIVHRDVTPHNVFVTYDGTVKVVDFGIAKAIGRATVTQHGIVKGKVRYMSPEQAGGDTVDRRTDIFAAGVLLWNAATGTKFWADRDDVAVMARLCSGDYPMSPRELCPDVPEEIDAICRRALAFRREDRYATAAEMRADLEAFLGSGTADARRALASTMKELFGPDRAALRTVLEASALTSSATLMAYSAARRVELELDGIDAPADARTEVMPGAPSASSPAAEVLSVSPMVVAGHSVDARATGEVARDAGASTAPRRDRSARFVQAAAALAVGLIVVVIALAARRPNIGWSPAPRDQRQAASCAEDRQTFSLEARAKAQRPPAPAAAVIAKTFSRAVTKAVSQPARPRAPTAVSESKDTSRAEPSAPSITAPGKSAQPPLDTSDPWASASRAAGKK